MPKPGILHAAEAADDAPPSFDTFPKLKKMKLDDIMFRRQVLVRAIKSNEAEKKESDNKVAAIMTALDIERVSVGKLRVKPSEGTNVQISKKLLLQNGVTADVIEKCTVRSKYQYLNVYDPDAREEGSSRDDE